MMRRVVLVAESAIHGLGLFAPVPFEAGTVLWEYAAGDCRVPLEQATPEALHYGYINPANPGFVVVCGDEARFWNFAENANCGEAEKPTATREARIIALRRIEAGEELTITFESDADAARKLALVGREPQLA